MKGPWTKRIFIGERQLDQLGDGSTTILKAFHKWWADGDECLDIMKYIRFKNGKEQCFFPVQHIQIVWSLAGPYLKLFKLEHS